MSHVTKYPFQLKVNPSGELEGADQEKIVYYRDMNDYYSEKNLFNKLGEKEIYRVFLKNVPAVPGELLQCTTVINPGVVNSEFFMTRGHIHKNRECCEIYHGIQGRGLLLLQNEYEVKTFLIEPKISIYIPGSWAHRVINISDDPLVFYSIWPGNSGYDYEYIKNHPFKNRVFKNGQNYEIEEILNG